MDEEREGAKKRRAAARASRRGRPADNGAPDDDGGAVEGPDALRAAREAATAAAVGAAVGAVRALTTRASGADDDGPPADDEPVGAEQQVHAAEARTQGVGRRQPDPPEPDDQRKGAEPRQALEMVERAREQLRTLHGADAEAVSSFERTRDGWTVTLEVVELRRIPESTDVLASYRVDLDSDGNLLGYERIRRYHRTEATDGLGR